MSNVSLASTDLLSHVEPLPLNQLICHSADTVRSWAAARRDDLLAVAYRDMAVARRNMAELTRCLDIQSTHIAACSGALDDNLPMMSAETFPRLTGGIRSALDETDQNPSVWSTFILPSASTEGGMNIQIKKCYTMSLLSCQPFYRSH